jgi:uncharacterized repeat protein (TIGR03803 family)
MQRTKMMSIAITTLAVIAVVLMPLDGARAASKEKVVHNFRHNGTDGYFPTAGLISDGAGNFYGTTFGGGSGRSGCQTYFHDGSCGTVFELTPGARGSWHEKVLHSFHNDGKDGYNPAAALIFDTAGNLYGTTTDGGMFTGCPPPFGCGTVFELTPGAHGKWTEKVLHSFRCGRTHTGGCNPAAGLILDTAGNLYGTTAGGGTASACCGTVFELTPAANGKWTEKVLHGFDCNTEGCGPVAGLIFDTAGNLYGTTFYNGAHFAGTVFELTPGSNGQWTEKVLSNFDQAGDQPAAGLIFDKAGNLYGTTSGGGAHFAGTVFELAPGSNGQWTEKVLYNFGNSSGDGASPYAGLIFDATGNLYGTTEGGGIGSGCPPFGLCGTIFELTPGTNGQWTEQVLHTFDSSGKDGWSPQASLIFDKAGNLYGTTRQGGVTVKAGTVFRLTP